MFFMSDDQLHMNKKTQGLARRALRGDQGGLAAMGLWVLSGALCQASLTDGRVTIEDLVSITLNPQVSHELADQLVAAGLWHASGHDCPRCPDVAEHEWVYHDWFAMGYDRGEQVKTKRAKSKELKDRNLIASVWARDCLNPAEPLIGACRYCGKELHKKNTSRNHPDAPQMDHVIPTLAAGVENVVLACKACNTTKAQRTPEEAGMTLRPAPTHNRPLEAAADAAEHRSPGNTAAGQDSSPSPAPSAPEPQRSAERTARSSVDAQREAASGSLLARGRDHAGAGRAGQGRAGEGEVRQGEVRQGQDTRPAPKPKRRRRGGTRSPRPEAPPPPAPNNGPAGPAPDVQTAGRFGSPWYGWQGRHSGVTETTCPEHGEEMPCRHCLEEGHLT